MPETVSRLGSLKRAALGIPTLFNSAALIWWMRASVKKTVKNTTLQQAEENHQDMFKISRRDRD